MKKKLGQILVEEKFITRNQLKKAMEYQAETGYRLGHALVALEFIEKSVLLRILEKQLHTKSLTYDEYNLKSTHTKLLTEEFCRKYFCVPIKQSQDTIMVAMADPLDLDVIDDIKFMTGINVATVLSFEEDIIRAINELYGYGKKEVSEDKAVEKAAEKSKAEVSSSPVVKMVNKIISDAADSRASDIHLEIYQDEIKLRFRVDGVLYYQKQPDYKYYKEIVSRMKIMANLDIAEKRLPQDGKILFKHEDREIDIRVSIVPSVYGENVVLRLLDRSKFLFSIEDIGIETSNLKLLKTEIARKHGMILVTGPTGSGKTTTLYSMLNLINATELKVITVEDPVEYYKKGISQVEVNPKIGLDFASALKSFLRHDPDVIMVGEIRDRETAEIAIRAALTGHLVLSTLHTNDSVATIVRLLDMGIPEYLVAATVNLIVAQRLVRVYGKGKKEFQGRQGIFEFLKMDDELRKHIINSESAEEIKKYLKTKGMKTLKDSGMQKIKDGKTSKEEVMRVIE